jgi:YHS domain-containing protein
MKKLYIIFALSTLLALPTMAQKQEGDKKTETKSGTKMATKVTATKTMAKAAPVKFTSCMVTGEKLDGSMGKPIMLKYKGQEYPVCCAGCKAPFEKEPEKYIKAAMAKMKTVTPAKSAAKPATKKA